MSEEALKDFLRKQARSLDSLLELTPAKTMFGEDVSDQWNRKKQTPDQKKAARMAKLDPANWKTAKDVYSDRSAEAARKRKREHEGSDGGGKPDLPPKDHSAKRPKHDRAEKIGERQREEVQNLNLKKRASKRAAKVERNRLKRERKLDVMNLQAGTTASGMNLEEVEPVQKSPPTVKQAKSTRGSKGKHDLELRNSPQTTTRNLHHNDKRRSLSDGEGKEYYDAEMADAESKPASEQLESAPRTNSRPKISKYREANSQDHNHSDDNSTAPSSEGLPEILSPPHDSASSSVSSVQPVTESLVIKERALGGDNAKPTKPSAAPQQTVQSEADRLAARQRLQGQISQFRSQRKADDRPVRSRAELLEQRRKKEQERKAAKKEQRRMEKEDEAKRQDEEIAKRFSPGGSGSLLASPRSPMMEEGGGNAFSFGRIAFEDGTQFDPATGSASNPKSKKGPSDPASALKAAQAKQVRLSGLDTEKKQDIAEKDMWLNAKKRAHGERVKDDTSLLKKALKRQEKQKRRSENDWDTRVEGVRSAQESKQKKRTENLQKRKDEKSAKKSGSKKVKRPGFEGSFRGRTTKSKKK